MDLPHKDPKPNLSGAAIEANAVYWDAQAKQINEKLRKAYEQRSKLYDLKADKKAKKDAQ